VLYAHLSGDPATKQFMMTRHITCRLNPENIHRRIAVLAVSFAAVATAMPAMAQYSGHMPPMDDTTMDAMPGMSMGQSMRHKHQDTTQGQPMMLPGPLGQPMERTGSGTSWLPDVSPMYAVHRTFRGWAVMLHGQGFVQYDDQGSRRGGVQFGSINWGMAMASHDFGTPTAAGAATSRLTFRTMLSLDPATVTPRGYPLLLQTGESYNGVPLHDQQHPHDLFMEVAAVYDRQLTRQLGLELYAAPSGEPATGPVAFMHRPSAANDPFAPISHHWQDATHISFGVLTAGLFTKTVKVEGSWFNGREPDQYRYNFDFRRFDSYSGRVTVNPDPRWSLEGSYAFLNSPEALTPDVSQHRVTAAAMYGHPFGSTGDWSTSVIYGANKNSDEAALSNSGLVETNLNLDERNTIFARAEYVQKSAADLALPGALAPLMGGVDTSRFGGRQFNVGVLALGYVRELLTGHAGDLGIGARGSINVVPDALRPYYGTRTPLGLGVFLRYRPNKMHMEMGDMKNMGHMAMPMPKSMPMDHTTPMPAMPGMAMPVDSGKTSTKTDSVTAGSTQVHDSTQVPAKATEKKKKTDGKKKPTPPAPMPMPMPMQSKQ